MPGQKVQFLDKPNGHSAQAPAASVNSEAMPAGGAPAQVDDQFSDKVTKNCKKRLIPGIRSRLRRKFRTIRKLRVNIARANLHADTPNAARSVSAAVTWILGIGNDLSKGIGDRDFPD